ncbi:MAG: hypothetical protein K8963_01435 [Proteobacteria bacterium]|nr:hypothetical protein [Pseudomonadota bacterium]
MVCRAILTLPPKKFYADEAAHLSRHRCADIIDGQRQHGRHARNANVARSPRHPHTDIRVCTPRSSNSPRSYGPRSYGPRNNGNPNVARTPRGHGRTCTSSIPQSYGRAHSASARTNNSSRTPRTPRGHGRAYSACTPRTAVLDILSIAGRIGEYAAC